MDKYSITLRKSPNFVVISYNLPEHPAKEEIDNMYFSRVRKMDEEGFDWEEVDSCCGYFMEADELIKEVISEHQLKEAA